MNNYSRQNCKGCIHELTDTNWYCALHKKEPESHCKDVEFHPLLAGRPPRIPNPPSKPVA